jgi:hypothetical protein
MVAMFLIKRGDVGPRVIMIQGILYELGANITIDGEFGRHTHQAVQDFQRRPDVGLHPDGQVGINTWQAMERITGYQVINVVDAEDPAQRLRVTSGLSRAGAHDVIEMWGQSNAVASAVSEVLSRAHGQGTAAMVRFYSHGGQGAQNVAAGHDPTMMSHLAGFTAAMMPQLASTFARLTDVLAPFGCVDLMGCSVGGGTAGQQLLTAMSNAVERPVEAGMNTQYSQDVGYIPFNFEGPVLQVYPSGVTRRAWGTQVQAQIPAMTPARP